MVFFVTALHSGSTLSGYLDRTVLFCYIALATLPLIFNETTWNTRLHLVGYYMVWSALWFRGVMNLPGTMM
jgi:hypothetical protein